MFASLQTTISFRVLLESCHPSEASVTNVEKNLGRQRTRRSIGLAAENLSFQHWTNSWMREHSCTPSSRLCSDSFCECYIFHSNGNYWVTFQMNTHRELKLSFLSVPRDELRFRGRWYELSAMRDYSQGCCVSSVPVSINNNCVVGSSSRLHVNFLNP